MRDSGHDRQVKSTAPELLPATTGFPQLWPFATRGTAQSNAGGPAFAPPFPRCLLVALYELPQRTARPLDSRLLASQSNGISNLVNRFKNHPLAAHINLVHGERSLLAELAANAL